MGTLLCFMLFCPHLCCDFRKRFFVGDRGVGWELAMVAVALFRHWVRGPPGEVNGWVGVSDGFVCGLCGVFDTNDLYLVALNKVSQGVAGRLLLLYDYITHCMCTLIMLMCSC
jgi:hypothetical protein